MQRMAAMAGLLAAAASAVADSGLRFVHEPYVPAPAVAGATAAPVAALPTASLAATAFQDDVEWSRRQREIARQEMWLYYRIGVGGYQRPSARFENFESTEFDADFDAGLIASFAVGGRYRIWDVGPWSRVGIRVELEGIFGYTPYDRLTRGSGPIAGDGDMFEYGFSVNVMPDIKLGRVSFFAGGGIGASLFTLSDSSSRDYEDSRGALALQLMAGASFELAEPVSLYTMFRYRTYSNVHFYDEFDERMRVIGLDGVAVEVGLEFRF
ncbi:MAG: porin family protein [Phycisphaerales bacterium]|nr:porin family protein [Phycisphaerales bacterium]